MPMDGWNAFWPSFPLRGSRTLPASRQCRFPLAGRGAGFPSEVIFSRATARKAFSSALPPRSNAHAPGSALAILQQAARNIFGAIGVGVTAPAWLNHTITIANGPLAGLTIPATRIFIVAVAVAVLGALNLLLARTRIGLLVRAVNQDREMAAASGINVRQVDLGVFCLGAGIAGLAGEAIGRDDRADPVRRCMGRCA